MKGILRLVVILLLCMASVYAGETGAFLKLGYGSRAQSMGSAFTAVINDSYAPYWNPAGLAYSENLSFTTTSFTWNESQAMYFGNITPLNQEHEALGLTYINFASAPVELYSSDAEYLGKSSSISDQAYILSYGRKINDIALGINIKNIASNIIDISASGYGVDIGALYKHEFSDRPWGLSQAILGYMLCDVGDTTIKYSNDTTDTISEQKRLGLSGYFNDSTLLLSFDYWFFKNRLPQKHYGLEYFIQKYLSISLGLQEQITDTELKKMSHVFSIGSSFKYDNFEFSYASVFHPQENMNFFSLNYLFNSIFSSKTNTDENTSEETELGLTTANAIAEPPSINIATISGLIYDEKNSTKLPATIKIINAKNRQVLGETKSTDKGTYSLAVTVASKEALIFSVQAENYTTYNTIVYTPTMNTTVNIKLAAAMQKIKKSKLDFFKKNK